MLWLYCRDLAGVFHGRLPVLMGIMQDMYRDNYLPHIHLIRQQQQALQMADLIKVDTKASCSTAPVPWHQGDAHTRMHACWLWRSCRCHCAARAAAVKGLSLRYRFFIWVLLLLGAVLRVKHSVAAIAWLAKAECVPNPSSASKSGTQKRTHRTGLAVAVLLMQAVEYFLQWWGAEVGDIWLHISKRGQVSCSTAQHSITTMV